MPDVFQVLRDCPHCHVESAVVELIDPGLQGGTSIDARCRLCGYHEDWGQVVDPGREFHAVVDVMAALEAWAEAEGEPDLRSFIDVNMSGLSVEQVCRRVLAGERVPTSFDVIAFLFPGMQGGTGGPSVGTHAPPLGARPSGPGLPGSGPSGGSGPGLRPLRPLPPEALIPQRTSDPDACAAVAARALAAVMIADGKVRAGEMRFLKGFLLQAGLQPLADADLRAWRPAELAIPDKPDPIVVAMVRLVHVDRQRDGTEWQVVREYARHWGYPLDKLEKLGGKAEAATAPAMIKLWRSLKSLFVTTPPPRGR